MEKRAILYVAGGGGYSNVAERKFSRRRRRSVNARSATHEACNRSARLVRAFRRGPDEHISRARRVQWLALGAIWKHATAIPVAVSLGGDLRKSERSSPVVSGRLSVAENDTTSVWDRRWSPLLGMNVLWAVSSTPQLIQPKGCSRTLRDAASAVRLLE